MKTGQKKETQGGFNILGKGEGPMEVWVTQKQMVFA